MLLKTSENVCSFYTTAHYELISQQQILIPWINLFSLKQRVQKTHLSSPSFHFSATHLSSPSQQDLQMSQNRKEWAHGIRSVLSVLPHGATTPLPTAPETVTPFQSLPQTPQKASKRRQKWWSREGSPSLHKGLWGVSRKREGGAGEENWRYWQQKEGFRGWRHKSEEKDQVFLSGE